MFKMIHYIISLEPEICMQKIALTCACALALSACSSDGGSTTTASTPSTPIPSTPIPSATTPSATTPSTGTPTAPSTNPVPTPINSAPTPPVSTPPTTPPANPVPSNPSVSAPNLGGATLNADGTAIVVNGKTINLATTADKQVAGESKFGVHFLLNNANQVLGVRAKDRQNKVAFGYLNGENAGVFMALQAPTADTDLPKNISATYAGDAIYKTDNAYYQGNVALHADFVRKDFDGVLKFPHMLQGGNLQKLGEDDEDGKYPIFLFAGDIKNGKLVGSDDLDNELKDVSGAFYDGYNGVAASFKSASGAGAFAAGKTSEKEEE